MSRFYNLCSSCIRTKLKKKKKIHLVGKTVLHIPLEVGDTDEMLLIAWEVGQDDL